MGLSRKRTSAADYLPLKPVRHLTLLLLAEEPTYGVALMERLEERSDGTVRLNAGSLYRLLATLVDDGLVEPSEEVANPAGVGAPRKLYAVTPLGREVLTAEARRQAGLLEMARALDLLGGA
jgi:DNA-binding PadR family transcriptional regulator